VRPIHLNLAAKPYRDYRPYIAVVAMAAVITAAMALYNVDTWLRYQRDTKKTRADIEKLERQITDGQHKGETMLQRLHSIDVKVLTTQTQYVNARLAERAFSWSELLDRMERVLPDDVRLETIGIAFTKEGIVHLTLSCVGKGDHSMPITVDSLNHNPHFSNPFPRNEDKTDTGYRFTIVTDYKPSIARIVE